jgi:ABC-2 type transport system permease protein
LCFLFYYGFEGIANQVKGFEDVIARIGMDYHFKSMARGVIDTRDVIYFLSISFLFLTMTVYKLKALKS